MEVTRRGFLGRAAAAVAGALVATGTRGKSAYGTLVEKKIQMRDGTTITASGVVNYQAPHEPSPGSGHLSIRTVSYRAAVAIAHGDFVYLKWGRVYPWTGAPNQRIIGVAQNTVKRGALVEVVVSGLTSVKII